MKDSHLTLRLPDDLARELERVAESSGVPKSMLVREAVATYLAAHSARPSKPRLLAGEFAVLWESLPHLGHAEAEAFEADLVRARDVFPPSRDPWALGMIRGHRPCGVASNAPDKR